MMFSPELHGQLARDRIERRLATAELLRQARQPSPSIRQAIGHRFIAIGARLAAEPSLESVRSR
ncbi:MAG: hypothetical protein ABJC39_08725 [Chloroflexota bacterium]